MDDFDEYEFDLEVSGYLSSLQPKYNFFILNKGFYQESFDKKYKVSFTEHKDAFEFAKSNKYRIMEVDIDGTSFPVRHRIGFATRKNYDFFLSLFTEIDRPLIWFLTGGFHRVHPRYEFDI